MKIAINTLFTATLLIGLPMDTRGIKLDRNGEITKAKEEEAPAALDAGRSGVKLTMDGDGNMKTMTSEEAAEKAPLTDRNGQVTNAKEEEKDVQTAEEGEERVNGDSGTVRFPGINLNNNGLRPTADRENPSSTTTTPGATGTEEESSNAEGGAPDTADESLDTVESSIDSIDSIDTPSNTNTTEAEDFVPCDDCKEIPFYCDLRVDFFEGEGKDPTDEETLSFVDKTEDWMNEVLSAQSPTLFYNLDIGEDLKALYDAAEPDSFSLEFSTIAYVLNQDDTMTIDNVYEFVKSADYTVWITDYIWETQPFMLNVFYNTHAVKMACYGGVRPSIARAAAKLNAAADQGERRLRGAATTTTPTSFGGHAVAARPTSA